MLETAKCLHIGDLQEGGTVTLSWMPVSGADQYIVERKNGSPDQPHTWGTLSASGITWNDMQTVGQTWDDLRQITGEYTVIYDGPGTAIRGPEAGLSWKGIHEKDQPWNMIEAKDQSWQELERLLGEDPGLSWKNIHDRDNTWSSIRAKDQEWQEFEDLIAAEDAPAWETEDHVSCLDTVPFAGMVAYRVKGYSAEDQSAYLETEFMPVEQIYDRKDYADQQVEQSNLYYLQLDGENMDKFAGPLIHVRYDASLLQVQTTEMMDDDLDIESNQAGELQFRMLRSDEKEKTWSGPVLLLTFTGKQSGFASIKLF